jgi:hypothetical protein
MSVRLLPDVRASATASSLNSLVNTLLCPMIFLSLVYHGLNFLSIKTGEGQSLLSLFQIHEHTNNLAIRSLFHFFMSLRKQLSH